MITTLKTDTLLHSRISANVNTGYQITTADGRQGRLAIIDADGNVIEAGAAVAKEAWNVCITVQKNFWIGQGHMVVHSSPPGLQHADSKAA